QQPTSKQLEAASQKKAQWLTAWKRKLIDDLNRKQFSGTITDTTGAEYIGISSADNRTAALKLPYGIARLSWTKLSPKTLLTISLCFIQPEAPGAADRQWFCGFYASATGQRGAAPQWAEAAVKFTPEYRHNCQSC